MKKNLVKIWGPLIIFIFIGLIYNSKTEYYQNNKAFYDKTFKGEILRIVPSRGTKVYYSTEEYFYLDSYTGVKLDVGNSFQKNKQKLNVFEKDIDGQVTFKGIGEADKPEESYFKFFFNLQ